MGLQRFLHVQHNQGNKDTEEKMKAGRTGGEMWKERGMKKNGWMAGSDGDQAE